VPRNGPEKSERRRRRALLPLKSIVEEVATPEGRLFDITVQVVIVLSLVSFSVDTLPDLSASTRYFLRVVEILTVAFFTSEYVLHLLVADRKLAFVCSFYGIVDLLSILPFYLSTGIDLRSVRAFRMLRVFRILKLARYSTAMRRFHRAFLLAREELFLFFFVTTMILYLSAVGIYFFENEAQPDDFASVFHSLWWSIITLTTVGYGDVYPITAGGRVFTFFILMVGLGIVAVPAGLLASSLSCAREKNWSPTMKTRTPRPRTKSAKYPRATGIGIAPSRFPGDAAEPDTRIVTSCGRGQRALQP